MKIEPNCLHKERPLKAKGLCGSCYNKSISYGNPEKRQKHLESRNLYAKRRRASSDPVTLSKNQRNRILKYRYGISQKDYDKILIAQDNRCAICQQEWVSKHPLYVDHDHNTGKARGLLCAKCNFTVGLVEKGDINKVTIYLENALARLELILRAQSAKGRENGI